MLRSATLDPLASGNDGEEVFFHVHYLYPCLCSSTKPKLMNKKFLVAAVVTTVVLFLLNGIMYAAILKNFFLSHPAVSPEFTRQLYRTDDQLIWWAVVACSLAIGLMVTKVISWSGARTFATGLKSGFIFGFLFLCSVDLGLYASTNNFTLAGALADMACSTVVLTISGAVAAWVLGRGRQQKTGQFFFSKSAW